jgi:outer membrane protein assembly factor BamA
MIGTIHIRGMQAFDSSSVVESFDTRTGQVLDPAQLEQDLDDLLNRYDQAGYVLAQATVENLILKQDPLPMLHIVIQVTEGPVLALGVIKVIGGTRTKPGYVSNVTGLRVGRSLQGYDPEEISRRLQETGLFREVNAVRLTVDENQRAMVEVELEEEAPGAFDVILGYLPPSVPNERGSIVGNINVLLKHAIGGGREFGFLFNRLPRQVTRIEVRASDPYLFGWPLRVAGSFQGFQQDTTYGTQQYRLETGYRLVEGLETFLSLSREITRPGGDNLRGIPASNTWFAGVGFRYQRLDVPANPRQGWIFVSNIEQGRKVRTREDLAGNLLTDVLRQTRLRLETRLFLPLRRRHVIALGLDASLLQSDSYDDSDLFRLGGAQSLRGYNEEQFLGNVATRALFEWRYQLDRTSYLFLFSDLGYYRRPSTDPNDVTPEVVQRDILPGYGFGIQFGTNAGLFSLSLALNPDEGLGSKIHIGMTLGL